MRLLLLAAGLCALAGLGACLPIHDQRLFVTNAMVRPAGQWARGISVQPLSGPCVEVIALLLLRRTPRERLLTSGWAL